MNYDQLLPKYMFSGPSVKIARIEAMENGNEKYYQYHKRIHYLKRLSVRFPAFKDKYDIEIEQCKEGQRLLMNWSKRINT